MTTDYEIKELVKEFDSFNASPLQKLLGWISGVREQAIMAAQRRFDPNFTRMQAELYNARHRQHRTPYFNQPLISSDSVGQTPRDMMLADPRWYNLADVAQSRDNLIDNLSARRYSPWVDPLEAKAWEQERIRERLKLLSRGGL